MYKHDTGSKNQVTKKGHKKQKIVGTVKNISRGERRSAVLGLRTRTSLMTLQQTLYQFTLSQWTAVKEMGLASILDMTVDGIPTKLGYFVIDNLDSNSMQLRLQRTSINITEELVHKTLGVANSGINLDACEVDHRSKVLFRAWRSQYRKKKLN